MPDFISALIKREDGKLLTLDHVKQGIFTIPVGKVDEEELPRDALVREMREEIGVTPTSYKLLEITEHLNRNGGSYKGYHFGVTTFEGTPYNKEPEKHLEMLYLPEWLIKCSLYKEHHPSMVALQDRLKWRKPDKDARLPNQPAYG